MLLSTWGVRALSVSVDSVISSEFGVFPSLRTLPQNLSRNPQNAQNAVMRILLLHLYVAVCSSLCLGTEKVCLTYPSERGWWLGLTKEKQALFDVTVSLDAGVTTLVGPSGSGKSTLAKILCGIQSPSSGRVVFKPSAPCVDFASGEATAILTETGNTQGMPAPRIGAYLDPRFYLSYDAKRTVKSFGLDDVGLPDPSLSISSLQESQRRVRPSYTRRFSALFI
jgi:hypothetical protein